MLEVVIDRVAVPLLAPPPDVEPSMAHTVLAFAGLFFMYFTGALAVIVSIAHCLRAVRTGTRVDFATHVVLGIATLVAAVPLIASMPGSYGVILELAFGAAVIALLVNAAMPPLGCARDRGILVGLGFIAVPLLLHVVSALGARYAWPDEVFDGPGVKLVNAGVLGLAFAALATPYCFAPRPFSRAVTRPLPVIAAMAIAASGAVVARLKYASVAKIAGLAIGVELNQTAADPRLALYLLAVATLAWTLASCATAPTPMRRQVGLGLALIVLGGHGFKWPDHYLLPLVGLALIARATRHVRAEELAAMPLASVTPPITDGAWAGYITSVAQGMRRSYVGVHSLTARGDDGLTSSVIVAETAGLAIRVKVERLDGSVLALDIVIGREIDEARPATLALWGVPDRGHGTNPASPAAHPPIASADTAFDEKFRIRGSADALAALFDADLRARAANGLAGWLAYWHREGLRYRVYPGHGATLDHPMPLQDLALGRTAPSERLVSVIELLVELGKRGVDPTAVEASSEHDEP